MKATRSKTEKRAAPAPAPAAQPVRAAGPSGRVQLQSALKVSSPSDPAEKEAEATARRIVRQPLPSPSVARFRDAVGAAGPLLSVARRAAGQPPDVTSNVAAEIAACAKRAVADLGGEWCQRIEIHASSVGSWAWSWD